MDDNISNVIEMSGMVLLFVFALSFGVLQYSRMMNHAEEMIDLNENNRMGTAMNNWSESSDIDRFTDFSEVYLSIIDIVKDNVQNQYDLLVNGGTPGSILTQKVKIEFASGAYFVTNFEYVATNNELKFSMLDGANIKVAGPYTVASDSFATVDYTFLEDSAFDPNDTSSIISKIKDESFTFSFEDNTLIYKLVI